MWHGQNPPNVIFIDIRKECQPHILGNVKNLPFKEQSFDVVFFDPPHHIPAKGFMYNEVYGEGLSPNQREALFLSVNNEFSRLLKPNGLLFCKTTNMPTNPGFSSKHMEYSLEVALTNFNLYSRIAFPSRGRSKNAMVCWSNYRRK